MSPGGKQYLAGKQYPGGKQYPVGTECACLRCGKPWRTRQAGRPPQCPNCHSSYWDKPRKERKSVPCGTKEKP